MQKYASYILYLLISVFVAVLYINDFGPMESVQRSVNDFFCGATSAEGIRPNVVIATIDGPTQDEYGNWPWGHDRIADLVSAIAGAEPGAILLDFELQADFTQDSAGNTDVLAEQLSWIDNLVIPYDIAPANFRDNKTNNPDHLFDYSVRVDNPLGIMEEKSTLQVRRVLLPPEKLLADDPCLGFDYTTLDDDRILRHQPLLMNFEGYYYPSQMLLGAAVKLGVPSDQIQVIEGKEIRVGNKVTIPINDKSEMFIKFPSENSYKRFSVASILGDGFNFDHLKDKLVIIDVDRFASNQYFKTPTEDQMLKSDVKAAVAENIVNRNFLTTPASQAMINLLLLFVIGGLCAFIMPQVSMLYRSLILLGGLFVLANINYFLFSSYGIIFESVYIALELGLFVLASPFLESELITGEVQLKAEARRKEKARAKELESALKEEAVPIRELKSSSSDPENVRTAALAADGAVPFMGDHQAIDIDGDTEQTTATPRPSDSLADDETSMTDLPPTGGEPQICGGDDDEYVPGVETDTVSELGGVPTSSGELAVDPSGIRNLGRYQIMGTLGKGAMGHVYKGVDPAINRPVALKTIRLDFVNDPDEMEELKERLFREAQAAGKLSHPNIVTIYDVGSHEQLQYIAMEYLEGRTLEDMIKKKTKFNYRIIARIITQICSALEYAHERGIVHRDIKPANIMVMENYLVKVMDYGIARVDSNSMTKTGIAMGTPNYISPEQLKGQKVDARSDIFSLGVVMYELLLGRRPFKGENLTSLIYAIVNHEPEKPSNINPQIPLLFDHIIGKALQKDPGQRYQKARELVGDLHDFVESFAS